MRGKVLKEVKTVIHRVMLRASRLSEEGKCYDVSYVTGVEVFVITCFHKLIHQPFDDKHRLSSHKKLIFKLTNIMCNSGHKSNWIKKIIFLSPLTTVHIFSILRSHGVHQKGRDLGTLNEMLLTVLTACSSDRMFPQ